MTSFHLTTVLTASRRFPFPLHAWHSDNGSEFLNTRSWPGVAAAESCGRRGAKPPNLRVEGRSALPLRGVPRSGSGSIAEEGTAKAEASDVAAPAADESRGGRRPSEPSALAVGRFGIPVIRRVPPSRNGGPV